MLVWFPSPVSKRSLNPFILIDVCGLLHKTYFSAQHSLLCDTLKMVRTLQLRNFLHWLQIFLKIFKIYFYREVKERRKRGRETPMCCCLSHAPCLGPGPQPRSVPWLGIKLGTLWFALPHSIHWAAPARAGFKILKSFFTC